MKFSLKSGSKTVATAGTRVALSTSPVWARGIRISAPSANAGVIYIGDNTVAAANGISIAAGGILSFSESFINPPGDLVAINLADVYVDAATNGDKVTFAYLEPVS